MQGAQGTADRPHPDLPQTAPHPTRRTQERPPETHEPGIINKQERINHLQIQQQSQGRRPPEQPHHLAQKPVVEPRPELQTEDPP